MFAPLRALCHSLLDRVSGRCGFYADPSYDASWTFDGSPSSCPGSDEGAFPTTGGSALPGWSLSSSDGSDAFADVESEGQGDGTEDDDDQAHYYDY